MIRIIGVQTSENRRFKQSLGIQNSCICKKYVPPSRLLPVPFYEECFHSNKSKEEHGPPNERSQLIPNINMIRKFFFMVTHKGLMSKDQTHPYCNLIVKEKWAYSIIFFPFTSRVNFTLISHLVCSTKAQSVSDDLVTNQTVGDVREKRKYFKARRRNPRGRLSWTDHIFKQDKRRDRFRMPSEFGQFGPRHLHDQRQKEITWGLWLHALTS